MSQITHFCAVQILSWKSGCVKFWTNSMSGHNMPLPPAGSWIFSKRLGQIGLKSNKMKLRTCMDSSRGFSLRSNQKNLNVVSRLICIWKDKKRSSIHFLHQYLYQCIKVFQKAFRSFGSYAFLVLISWTRNPSSASLNTLDQLYDDGLIINRGKRGSGHNDIL